MKGTILIVEDERSIQIALSALFKKRGFDISIASAAESAIETIQRGGIDLVLTDLALGAEKKTGMDVLCAAVDARPSIPVILMTAYGNEKLAVQAMQAGAADYVPKPFDNDEILLVVERALDRTRLERDHRLLLDRVEREQGLGALLGNSAPMRKVFETIHKVAETDLTVLVRGESGTGKELVAQALHDKSSRKKRPFVAVNCAAISRELVESELFGHEKGAFTGADARRVGRFEQANGGTILLDEIGDMPLETQAKVLRVLQEHRVERVGSSLPCKVDARVVAATHRDLESDVKKGRFREDLYYRLRVVEIVLPPLRDRSDDIPLLTARFLVDLAERLGRKPATISPQALARLSRHPFPGNVRELRNAIERAAVLASGSTIEESDFDPPTSEARADRDLQNTEEIDCSIPFSEAKKQAAQTFERSYLMSALSRHQGNVSRTAEAIGMVRQSLQQKIRELGLRGTSKDDDEG